MTTRRDFVLGTGVAAAASVALGDSARAREGPEPAARPPAWAGSRSRFEFLRMEENWLAQEGGDDLLAGMNEMGKSGWELMAVTSNFETGAAGYYLFKREVREDAAGRPAFEFRRMDETELTNLDGAGNINAALATLTDDGWQVGAFTQTLKGGMGWWYFQRAKRPEPA